MHARAQRETSDPCSWVVIRQERRGARGWVRTVSDDPNVGHRGFALGGDPQAWRQEGYVVATTWSSLPPTCFVVEPVRGSRDFVVTVNDAAPVYQRVERETTVGIGVRGGVKLLFGSQEVCVCLSSEGDELDVLLVTATNSDDDDDDNGDDVRVAAPICLPVGEAVVIGSEAPPLEPQPDVLPAHCRLTRVTLAEVLVEDLGWESELDSGVWVRLEGSLPFGPSGGPARVALAVGHCRRRFVLEAMFRS